MIRLDDRPLQMFPWLSKWTLFGLSLTALGWPNMTLAAPSCTQLFTQRKYLEAGRCFHLQARQMKPAAQLSKIDRFAKEQLLRTAARAYSMAAQKEKDVAKAAWIREQAHAALSQYLQEKLCLNPRQCRTIRRKKAALLVQIQYTQLTLITGDKPATVDISGFHYKTTHQAPPNWNEKVRPGTYTISIRYKGHPAQTKRVTVLPNKPVLLMFHPPKRRAPKPRLVVVVVKRRTPPAPRTPPKPRSSVVPWILVGVSGTILVLGGVAFIGGAMALADRDDIYLGLLAKETVAERQTQIKEIKKEFGSFENAESDFRAAHEEATAFFTTAWVLSGVGAVGLTAGLIWALAAKSAAPPTPSPPAAQPNPRSLLWEMSP